MTLSFIKCKKLTCKYFNLNIRYSYIYSKTIALWELAPVIKLVLSKYEEQFNVTLYDHFLKIRNIFN